VIRKALLATALIALMGAVALGGLVSTVAGAGMDGSGVMLGAAMAANAKEGQGDVLGTCDLPPGSGQNAAGAHVAAVAAKAAGFTGQNLVVAVAVAGAESGWRPNATHLNDDGSTDFGEWQINSVHVDLLATGDWADPYSNARMAHSVWASSGWGAWTTFTSGAFRLRMADAIAAVGGAKGSPVPTCTPPTPGQPGSGEGHLTPATVAMKRALEAKFPGHVVGCYRTMEDGGEHPRGRACDFMTGIPAGNAAAAWLQQNASALHILYLIHTQHIWSVARASEGWRYMAPRGSPTADHMDHVHISVACVGGEPAWAGCP
jgi:hypothetical protein